MTLAVNQTKNLQATVQPDNASNKAVAWESYNASVATVDSNGQVKAIAEGTTTIEVRTNEGGITENCVVTVVPFVHVTSVRLSQAVLMLQIGQTETIETTVLPNSATDKSVTWSSNNTSVATINANGLVTAKAAGTAEITVKTNDGDKMATRIVSVYQPGVKIPTTGLTLNKEAMLIGININMPLEAKIYPPNATNQNVVWKSGDESIAKVNANGIVTGVTPGDVEIWAVTVDGDYPSSPCKVTVTPTMVYVAGYDTDKDNRLVATVWKNATAEYLDEGRHGSEACSIFITDDGEEYVAGRVLTTSDNTITVNVATIWENGSPTNLTDGTKAAVAQSIFVTKNGDVYAGGYEAVSPQGGIGANAVIWKNGNPTYLTNSTNTNGSDMAWVNSIFVLNDDVYAVGYECENFRNRPMLWKNNEPPKRLDFPASAQTSMAFTVYVTPTGDVHIGGTATIQNVAKPIYWKNDEPYKLLAPTTGYDWEGGVRSIFVTEGDDVYMTGYLIERINEWQNRMGKAMLWKNGVATELSWEGQNVSGTELIVGTSVFVLGNDVYVAGNMQLQSMANIPLLWVNNAPPQRLSNASDARVRAISARKFD
jgi:uncharacterized protein YjdB